jgi:pyruvate/2-oxoglutarate dehydrogenase complex dihydrolipoamide acyltransferase (E2) component
MKTSLTQGATLAQASRKNPLLRRNVDFGPPLRLSPWRKIAIGTWRTAGDPSVYSSLLLDAGPALAYLERLRSETGERVTLTHVVGSLMAQVLHKHPDINCVLRWGRLYPRESVDVFFQVATDDAGQDLSGTLVRFAEKKSPVDLAREMRERVEAIRKKGDPQYRQMKGLFGKMPGFLAAWVLKAAETLMYTFNLWSPLIGSPRDSFGSLMITNIGSLGLEEAYAPLVPYSRVPLLIALGAVKDTPVVRDGQVVIRPMIRLCVTFDHRLIDGVHAAKMARTLTSLFEALR